MTSGAFADSLQIAARHALGETVVDAGSQFFVRIGDIDASCSSGAAVGAMPLNEDVAFNVYCAGKPTMAWAVLAALEDGGVACDPNRPLATLLDTNGSSFGDTSLADLLSHFVGQPWPDLFVYLNGRTSERPKMERACLNRRQFSREYAYSPIVLATALRAIVRRQLSADLNEVLTSKLRQLDLANSYFRRSSPGGIGAYIDSTTERPFPMLHDRLRDFYDSPFGLLSGFYTTAKDMGHWYSAVQSIYNGSTVEGMPSPDLVESFRQGRSDSEVAPYELAMAALHLHGLTALSDQARGHFGFVRSSLFAHDPDSGSVICGIVRDLALDRQEERLAEWNVLCDWVAAQAPSVT